MCVPLILVFSLQPYVSQLVLMHAQARRAWKSIGVQSPMSPSTRYGALVYRFIKPVRLQFRRRPPSLKLLDCYSVQRRGVT